MATLWLDLKGPILADTVYIGGTLVAKDVTIALPAVTPVTADFKAMGSYTAPILGQIEAMEASITKIGIDLGLLENRINFSADWYQRNNYDLIGVVPTQGVGGVINKYANVATMKSHGVEFTLSTRNIRTNDFSWNTAFIFSYANHDPP